MYTVVYDASWRLHADRPSQRTVNDVVPYACLTLLKEEPNCSGSFGPILYKAYHNGWECQVAYKKLDVRVISERTKSHKK